MGELAQTRMDGFVFFSTSSLLSLFHLYSCIRSGCSARRAAVWSHLWHPRVHQLPSLLSASANGDHPPPQQEASTSVLDNMLDLLFKHLYKGWMNNECACVMDGWKAPRTTFSHPHLESPCGGWFKSEHLKSGWGTCSRSAGAEVRILCFFVEWLPIWDVKTMAYVSQVANSWLLSSHWSHRMLHGWLPQLWPSGFGHSLGDEEITSVASVYDWHLRWTGGLLHYQMGG